MLPEARSIGRPRVHSLREIVDRIRYVQKYGTSSDAMPRDRPCSSICYDFWRRLADQRHIQQIDHLIVMADREKAGREPCPTLAIIHAKPITCDVSDGHRGYDVARTVSGCKRHLAVDTDGRLRGMDVTTANVQDQDGDLPRARRFVRPFSWIETTVGGDGYKAKFIDGVKNGLGSVVEFVEIPQIAKESLPSSNDGVPKK